METRDELMIRRIPSHNQNSLLNIHQDLLRHLYSELSEIMIPLPKHHHKLLQRVPLGASMNHSHREPKHTKSFSNTSNLNPNVLLAMVVNW